MEIEVKNYRDEVQTLTESARSNLAISLERDSLREKLDEMTSQQEGLLSKIDQLETSISQLKTEVRIPVFYIPILLILIIFSLKTFQVRSSKRYHCQSSDSNRQMR